MENISEYRNYWETNAFFQSEEFDLGYLEEPNNNNNNNNSSCGGYSYYDDSSSPDGSGTHDYSPAAAASAASSSSSKNIMSERNRRKKLNDRLYALRAVVPNITKMDKASIIKDAIEYIKTLHEEQSRMQTEIMELEENGIRPVSNNSSSSTGRLFEYDHPEATTTLQQQQQNKRTRFRDYGNYNTCTDYCQSLLIGSSRPAAAGFSFSPIEVLELRVTNMGDKILQVSLTCSCKRTDTMVKLCEIFESLNLNIITATITAFPGTLMKNVFLEADEEENEVIRQKIKSAIAALNDPDSPMSS